ncbi:MAG: glycosyltransferase family 39 protein [Candidatus Coatesbacteria bacterium]|nr:MAG: glycosyltransferase family 39 protein [Candidatus Coatesbacteria bacterium]
MDNKLTPSAPGRPRLGAAPERLAPFGVFASKLGVAAAFVAYYVLHFKRIMYIADGPGRAIEAYRLAYGAFELFPRHQFPPLPLWLWAGLLKIWPDIYFTGTALNVVAGAGVAAFLYLLGRRLAGPVAGIVAAGLFTFSPVHHNLTLSMGMAEPMFYLGLVAGVFFAARAEAGLRGAAAASFCFAGAALCRYEATAFLLLYTAYRLFHHRPRNVLAWVLWALPVALAGVFVAHKGLQPSHAGLWPALAGVRADTAAVLSNPTWYRRLGYGFYRFLFDGRASAALAFAGAILFFRKEWFSRDRFFIWLAWALIFAALSIIALLVGLGFCPERYFATPLLLIFPFAGLTVVALIRWADSTWKKIVVDVVLVAAAVITIHWDAVILRPGYGYPGPCTTHPAYATETALTLRELWRTGEMAPDETVIIEIGEPGATGAWRFEEYPLRAFSDHPLNFLRLSCSEVASTWPGLLALMKTNEARIAIIVSDRNRELVRSDYDRILRETVVYENPTQTIIVRREGWRTVPDFASRVSPDRATIYDVPPGNF